LKRKTVIPKQYSAKT